MRCVISSISNNTSENDTVASRGEPISLTGQAPMVRVSDPFRSPLGWRVKGSFQGRLAGGRESGLRPIRQGYYQVLNIFLQASGGAEYWKLSLNNNFLPRSLRSLEQSHQLCEISAQSACCARSFQFGRLRRAATTFGKSTAYSRRSLHLLLL